MNVKNALAEHLTSSLYTYVEDGMGYTLFKQPHEEMCRELEEALPPPPDQMNKAQQKHFMMLAPRETLKTSIGAQGLIEYFLTKWKTEYNYDGRVLLIRAARETAQEVLKAISIDLSSGNAVLQQAFGDLSKKPDGSDSPTWKNEAIILGWRDKVYREPSISTGAPGHSATGKHVDLIVIDDIANETNYLSEPKMRSAWTLIQSLDAVLSPWGSMVVIGTRWGIDDPYGKILELNERERKAGKPEPWKTLIRSARSENGRLYYPAFLTNERLAQKKAGMDEKLYTAFYENKVIADSSRVFKESHLQFYEGDYTPDNDEIAELEITECSNPSLKGMAFPVRCTLHLDGATTVTDDANYTSYSIVLTDIDGRHWVHKCVKKKMVPSDTVFNIVADCREFVPRGLSIDVLGQQALWIDLIGQALRDSGLSVLILENKGKGKDAKLGHGILSKAKKIESLEPLFRQGLIFLRSGFCEPIVNEYKNYTGPTKTNHYDALDALSHIVTMTQKPSAERYKDEMNRISLKESEEIEAREEFDEFGDDVPRRRMAWAGR